MNLVKCAKKQKMSKSLNCSNNSEIYSFSELSEFSELNFYPTGKKTLSHLVLTDMFCILPSVFLHHQWLCRGQQQWWQNERTTHLSRSGAASGQTLTQLLLSSTFCSFVLSKSIGSVVTNWCNCSAQRGLFRTRHSLCNVHTDALTGLSLM